MINFNEIKKSLAPNKNTKKKIQKIKKQVKKRIEEEGYETVSVGSTSRETYLPGEIDIDIFFYMPKNTSREELEEKGVEIGKKALKGYNPRTHYAEHPYVKGQRENIEIEVVPCYKTTGEIKSAVDRTPLHDEYLNNTLSEKDKEEIRLLKQFMANIGCYGANEEVRGFSGFLCELLVVKYGSFKEVIEAAAKWKRKEHIDLEDHGEKKFEDSLVVIDPVDPDRNVAAALSQKKLGRFILKAREMLENPSRETFEGEVEINNEILKGKNILITTIPVPKETVSEIIWAQLRKLKDNLKEELEKQGFKVYRAVHWTDEENKAEIMLDVETKKIPKYEKHRGPELYRKEHVEKFKKKNKNIFIKKNRLYAWKERKNTRIEKSIKNFFSSDRVPSRFEGLDRNPKIIKEHEKVKKHKEVLKEYFRL